MRRSALVACLAGSLAWTTATVNAADLQLFRPLVTAIHVHSTASTGTLDLDALAERAEHLGIEALLLSENLALRYEYDWNRSEEHSKYHYLFRHLSRMA